jgi:hypothetical protein
MALEMEQVIAAVIEPAIDNGGFGVRAAQRIASEKRKKLSPSTSRKSTGGKRGR